MFLTVTSVVCNFHDKKIFKSKPGDNLKKLRKIVLTAVIIFYYLNIFQNMFAPRAQCAQ